MGSITLASLMIPEEAYVLLIVASGFLIMIGLRRIALALMGFVILSILLPPFIEPILAELPNWVIWGMLFALLLSLLRAFLGREIWGNMWGTLLGNLLTAVILGMLRLPGLIFQGILRAATPRRRE